MKLNLIQGSNVTASDECNESKLTGILGDPLKALETNDCTEKRSSSSKGNKWVGIYSLPINEGNNHLLSEGTKHHPCSNIQEKQNSDPKPIPTKRIDTQHDVTSKPEHIVHKPASKKNVKSPPSRTKETTI